MATDRKWPRAFAATAVAPRPSMLEAGFELFTLAVLGATVAALDILPLSWHGLTLAGVAYMAIAGVLMTGLVRHSPHRHFGIANTITLCRAAFDIVLLVVVAETLLGNSYLMGAEFRWGLTIAAAAALMLDGIDGWAARRGNMTSDFGARFDMETDAAFIFALTAILTVSGTVGAWVLLSGLSYYAFRAASHFWPALNAPLFPSWRRKTICVAQGALLVAALAPIMPQWGAQLCCASGLALLLYSFGIDTLWLIRQSKSAD